MINLTYSIADASLKEAPQNMISACLPKMQVKSMHDAQPSRASCVKGHIIRTWLILTLFAGSAYSNAAADGELSHCYTVLLQLRSNVQGHISAGNTVTGCKLTAAVWPYRRCIAAVQRQHHQL